MSKRGRGVSTRLKAISMTFKDGLITVDDKNRLKDLLLLGDSSLEDALDGVLSGDKTKILGKRILAFGDAESREISQRGRWYEASQGGESAGKYADYVVK